MTDENHPRADEDIVEFYAAGSEVEADRIVLLLGDDGIEAHRRETSVPLVPSDGSSRHLITVFESDVERARALVKQAIADDVLPSSGMFL